MCRRYILGLDVTFLTRLVLVAVSRLIVSEREMFDNIWKRSSPFLFNIRNVMFTSSVNNLGLRIIPSLLKAFRRCIRIDHTTRTDLLIVMSKLGLK
jgi:hypothetical protein